MLYWVGPRDSDIDYTENFFGGAITLFGDESLKNSSAFCKNYHSRVNHNIIDVDQDNFTISEIVRRIEDDEDAQFMFYNPNIVYKLEKLRSLKERILCLNDVELMEKLNNKISFRKLFCSQVDMLKCKVIMSRDCDYQKLRNIFGIVHKQTEFIIQAPVASGGYGTFLLSEKNNHIIKDEIVADTEYLVSEYIQESISVNGHLVIFDKGILLTPCSVQIIKESNNRLFYRGADFVTYRQISKEQRKVFETKMYKIGKKLQLMGYRGLCGVDGIITKNNVYIMEINNRFQASTPLINLSLSKVGLPSLHEMNKISFEGKELPKEYLSIIPNLEINYSNYIFMSGAVDFHHKNFLELLMTQKHKTVEKVVLDGYNPAQACEEDSYQYKVIFNTNITGIDGNGKVIIYNNIVEPEQEFYRKVERKELLYLKIALLSQGVRFSQNAKKYLENKGGIRPGTNSSVDIVMKDIVINCPVYLKFSEFSPFLIDVRNNEVVLFYYNGKIRPISINPIDIYSFKETSNGVLFDNIANMSSDRLRLHHTCACLFKKSGRGCKFCDIRMGHDYFGIEDIHEVIDFYLENTQFDHFLVGGQSECAELEYPYIVDTINYIRQKSDKKIYVMCLPPADVDIIDQMYQAGATEIGFNIELFDREYAAKIMPGKGQIPIEQYIRALEHAVGVFGKNGEVRSLILVGLERDEILLKGVKMLAERHIQPILSVFRPLPDTVMYHEIQPSNDYLISTYKKATEICKQFDMKLGPTCVKCQNNTLSLP